MSNLRIKTTLITLILAATVGCSRDRGASSPDDADSSTIPTMVTRGATISILSGEMVSTEIHAVNLKEWDTADSVMGYIIDANFFDSLGRITTHLVADSALIREKTGELEAYGHVIVETKDDHILESEYLRWDRKSDTIFCNSPFKYTETDGVVVGDSLWYDCKTGSRRYFNPSGVADNLDGLVDE